MKRTKIICTMGPNTDDEEMMRKLAKAGMDIARFNFSHGDHEEQKTRMETADQTRTTPLPEIREKTVSMRRRRRRTSSRKRMKSWKNTVR